MKMRWELRRLRVISVEPRRVVSFLSPTNASAEYWEVVKSEAREKE